MLPPIETRNSVEAFITQLIKWVTNDYTTHQKSSHPFYKGTIVFKVEHLGNEVSLRLPNGKWVMSIITWRTNPPEFITSFGVSQKYVNQEDFVASLLKHLALFKTNNPLFPQ